MENQIAKIESSFENTIKENSLDIFSDLTEIGIDTLIDNEAIKEIPVLKLIIAVGKGIISIRNFFLYQKVFYFLYSLKDVSKEKRKKFLNKMESKRNLTTNISSFILSILDKVDEKMKASIIGFIFKKMVAEEINHENGLRAISVIEKAFYNDLFKFCTLPTNEEIKVDLFRTSETEKEKQILLDSLNAWGVLTQIQGTTYVQVDSVPPYDSQLFILNPFGEILQGILNEWTHKKNKKC